MKEITIIGNLTKDCKVVPTANGEFVAIAVAVNEKFNGNETTTYFDVASNFTKLAPYLNKGTKVFVRGGFSLKQYQKQDGTMQSYISINASKIELLGGKVDAQNPQAQAQPQTMQQAVNMVQQAFNAQPVQQQIEPLPF